jgi:2-oxoglutarate ferredoxin oxidoreductase subunit alpha
MTSLTKGAVTPLGVKPRDAERSKNFFALGLVSWMYTRPIEPTLDWVKQKFASKPDIIEANTAAFKAGYAFGERGQARGPPPWNLHEHHRQHRAGVGAHRRQPARRAAGAAR